MVIGGLGQRRADGGQQGRRHPLRAGLVRGDRGARPRAQRRPGRLGRRPDALARRDDPVRRGVPHAPRSAGDERHVRRIGQLASTSRPASCRRCPSPRSGARPMPEGHTLHRLATDLDDRVRRPPRSRVGSPQGRFAESAALVDGRVLDGAEADGKHLFVEFDDDRRRPRPPRPLRPLRRARRRRARCPSPVGQVRLRLVRAPTAYADLRGATAASWSARAARRGPGAPRPGPAAAGRRPRRAPGDGSGAAAARSATC